MPNITTKDGTELYYKDWGEGRPVVFSHGWPLSSDAFEDQMYFLARRGYRCVAHDRRGHGRSAQPLGGNDLDTYADDLAQLVEALDLKGAIHVGHSTGGGEVTRYIGRYGTGRVAGAVLIGAIPPLMLKAEANPEGTPIEVFDQIRAGVLKNAIDWASRPYGGSAWAGKPAAVMGASTGAIGTARAQYHLRQVMVFLDMFPVNQPEVMIGNAARRFDAEGNLTDEQTREFIRQLLRKLVEWTRRLSG